MDSKRAMEVLHALIEAKAFSAIAQPNGSPALVYDCAAFATVIQSAFAEELAGMEAENARLRGANNKALARFVAIECVSPVWSMGSDENVERLKKIAREAQKELLDAP